MERVDPRQQCDSQACWDLLACQLLILISSPVLHLLNRVCHPHPAACSRALCSSIGAAQEGHAPCSWAPWQLFFLVDFSHHRINSLSLNPCPVFPPIQVRFNEKCHFFAPCPTFSSLFWWRCEVPPALHSLVTAYLQRSQARASGTAPRSGLGDRGVSQETEHKYRDPNNLITSGAIRSRILGAYPGEGVCVWRSAVEG